MTGNDVLAVIEHREETIRDVSYELITAGQDLCAETGGDLHLAVISGHVDQFAADVNRQGVDRIHIVEYGDEFNHDVYVQTVDQLADAVDARYIITPHSVNGLDYAPAVATKLEAALVTDVIACTTDDNGDILVTKREMYGGKVQASIETDDRAVVTIRPAEWPETTGDGNATIDSASVDIDEDRIRSTVGGFDAVTDGDVDITEASVLVSVGRGIGEEEHLELIFELAETLDATVAASRPIVDNEWLPKDRQVGQSGKVVTPDVYLAIGISGAVQHVAGMKGAETIIAINSDPNAPIFDIADYAIVDDLFDVVPALIDAFEA